MEKTMRAFFAVLAVVAAFWACPATAQSGSPDLSAHMAAMERLSFLHGKWTGEGWIVGRDRVRRAFRQTVEGTGTEISANDPIFRAFAVMSWDPAQNRYAFHSWLDGRSHEVAGELISENLFRWSFSPSPSIQIRYTIDGRTANRWHEIGEASTDGGATFNRFFEMTLTKD